MMEMDHIRNVPRGLVMDMYKCILWLWRISRSVRIRVALSGMAGILRMCISLLFVWVSKRLVDIATGHIDEGFSLYIMLMGGCIVAQLALSIIRERLDSLNTVCLKNELRHYFFTRLMQSQWSGKERFHTGDMVNRLLEDVKVVSELVCVSISSMFVTAIQLVGAFIFMMLLDNRIAWVVLFIMPVALLISRSYLKRMRKLTKEIRLIDSHVQEHMQENLQNHILVSSLGRVTGVVDRLFILQEGLRKQIMQRTDFSLFSRTVVQIGFVSGYAVAFLWGIFGLREGTITFGAMTAFLQLVSMVQRPMVDLGRYVSNFVHMTASVERLEELGRLPVEKQGEINIEGNVGIRLNNVSFTYPDGKRKVINEFSYDFVPGSCTLVVGETGAGKSTLVRLMLALLSPQNGNISLYNERQENIVSPMTRCNFIYVPQGNTLMSGTVKDNLLLGNPNATEAELRQALYTAAADFVFDLPTGLDTFCGEKGSGLSEGQAQRISIARGILHSGSILLLDEPTSALDMDTERVLIERLTTQLADKTLILITHRELNVGRKVDIIQLDRSNEIN